MQDPLVAVTSVAMVGDRDRVLRAGFDGYLSKPLDPERLVAQEENFLPPEKHCRRVPAVTVSAGEDAAASPPRHGCILVVDDCPVNLSLIRSTLEPFGDEVITADGPETGFALARERSLDLIVSDLHMPNYTGPDFLRWLKAGPRMRTTPVIIYSASVSDETEHHQAIRLGAAKSISRPIEPEVLLSHIEECLVRK
jgi:two-component system cell cycle response regulator